jgi:hypothetical protein
MLSSRLERWRGRGSGVRLVLARIEPIVLVILIVGLGPGRDRLFVLVFGWVDMALRVRASGSLTVMSGERVFLFVCTVDFGIGLARRGVLHVCELPPGGPRTRVFWIGDAVVRFSECRRSWSRQSRVERGEQSDGRSPYVEVVFPARIGVIIVVVVAVMCGMRGRHALRVVICAVRREPTVGQARREAAHQPG